MKPGTTNRPGCVECLGAVVRAEPGDDAVDDCDVALEPLAGEDRQDAATANDEVGGLVPAGDGNRSFETATSRVTILGNGRSRHLPSFAPAELLERSPVAISRPAREYGDCEAVRAGPIDGPLR